MCLVERIFLLLLLPQAAFAELRMNNVYPTTLEIGKTTELTLEGPEDLSIWTSFKAETDWVEPGKKLKTTVPAGVQAGVNGMVFAHPEGITQPFLLMLDDLPVQRLRQPPNDVSHPHPIPVPSGISSRFNRTPVYFKIELTEPRELSLDVYGERLGSPVDPMLRILDTEGRELAMADDVTSKTSDPRLRFRFEKAGAYVIEVSDMLYTRGGPFHLRVGDFAFKDEDVVTQPTIRVKAEKESRISRSVEPKGALVFDLICRHRGYEGPIRIKSNHPELKLLNASFPASRTEHRVFVLFPDKAEAGSLWPVALHAELDNGRRVPVSQLNPVRAAWSDWGDAPAWLRTTMFV
ncbi:MAG: hypothetical protein AAF492_10150, partial [Verrucomicrobiota bacterium]